MFTKLQQISSLLTLLTVNLIPLYGVLNLGWDTSSLLILYWIENIIVGFYNVLKLFLVTQNYKNPKSIRSMGLGIIPFFMVHYGLFSFVHGIFILIIVGGSVFSQGLNQFNLAETLATIMLPSLFLFLSHGQSFFMNYVGRKEYLRTTAFLQMFAPYKRVAIVHLAILFGFIFSMLYSSSLIPAVILILLKTGTDAWIHLKEHRFFS